MDADARLALLDRQGLDKVFLFPSLAITTQPIFWHDHELLLASARAFNRWLLDRITSYNVCYTKLLRLLMVSSLR